MVELKRTLALVVAAVGLTIVAGSASAFSSVNLVWNQTGTDTVDSLTTAPASAIVTASIVLQGDSVGVGGVFISILFDTDELFATSAAALPSVKIGMGNSFTAIGPGMAIDNVAGSITLFASATVSTGCINCTVTLGSVVFHVLNPSDVDGPNDAVASGSFNPGIDAITSAIGGPLGGIQIFDTQFGGAEVLPEPATALLVLGGILSLGYAGRRNVR